MAFTPMPFLPHGNRAGVGFHGALQGRAQAQHERSFRHHEQWPDDQAAHVVDKCRFAAFVVMADELDDPAHHERPQPGAEP